VNFTKAGLKLLFKEKTREETIKEDLEANILMDVNPSEEIYTTRINTIVERYIPCC
jgi:hypothetical protein